MAGRAVGPTSGPVRLLRAATLGGLSLLLAGGAHLVGGGALPGPGVLVVAAILLGLVATLLTARRCGFAVLTLLLAGQQVLLHTLFTLAGGAAHVHLAEHAHGGAPSGVGLAPDVLHAAGAAPDMVMAGPTWLMWAAHVVATLATAWLLARGEAWLWRAADAVATAAGLRCRVRVRRTAGASVRPAAVSSRLLTPVWLVAGPRGPPTVAAG